MGLDKLLPRFVIAASMCVAAYALLTPKAVPLDNLGRAAVLSGPDMYGRPLALSDFAGKVVLVAFWATWCPGCREDVPGLINLQKKLKDRGFTVLGVSVDQDIAAVAPFARAAGITYPVMEIPGPRSPEGWHIPGLPIGFLVARDGTIVRHYDGYAGMDAMQADIKSALAR
jgi:thiol-disulfide isomerase/thioredoxin